LIVIKKIPYALTYAPSLRFQVMTQMLVICDYNMESVHIMYQTDSPNNLFLTEYRESLNEQCNLLKIPTREDVFIAGMESYHFVENSAIIVLADTAVLPQYFTPRVLASIPSSSYIALTNLNSDVGDIFQPATAIVFTIAPINFTPTTNLVQSSVKNPFVFYGVYGAYDTLLTLNSLIETSQAFNITNYTNISVNIPLSYSNSTTFDLTTNAINYGNYDIMFTRNVLLSCPRDLDIFLKSTSRGLGISSLRDSYSVFRTAGIIPFFSNGFYYVLQNLSKIYNEEKRNCCKNNNDLLAVKFEKNIASFITPDGNEKVEVNISENNPSRFYYTYDAQSQYFSLLERINECGICPPCVNSTMSKKTGLLYI
jgi:hypothetical protein